jgi:hypothetical protein
MTEENITNTDDSVSPQQEPQTFSQADLERIIGERLRREREKFADYEQLQEQATQWQAHVDEQRSEAERLQDNLAQVENERNTFQQQLVQERIRNAVINEASRMDVVDPDGAYRLLDLGQVRMGETGQVEGVSEALQGLIAEKDYLVKRASRPSSSATNLPSEQDQARARMSKEVRQRMGLEEASSVAWDADFHRTGGGGVLDPSGTMEREGEPPERPEEE